jgi:hypothetical protein
MAWLGDFRSEVWQKTQITDLVVISTVPIILVAVFLLPKSMQTAMFLDYGNYSLFNLWSSAFVHRGFNHLSNNLGAFCILIGPIYLLFALADELKLFRYTFISFLLVLPLVIAIINIGVLDSGTGAGFSGIGAAFFGLLPVSLFLFIHNKVSDEIEPANGVVLFLLAAAIITKTYLSITGAAGILLFAVLITIYDVYKIGIDELQEATTELTTMKGHFELVMIAGLLFLISPMLLFPENITQSKGAVNILSHYLGLFFGFFGPTFYLFYRRYQQQSLLGTQRG